MTNNKERKWAVSYSVTNSDGRSFDIENGWTVTARTINGALRKSLDLAHEMMSLATVDLVEVRRITVIEEEAE